MASVTARRWLLLAALPLLAVNVPARAQGTVITNGPGAAITGYATPAAVSTQGGPVTYINGDPVTHDVIAKQFGPGNQPWCASFPLNRCPLFFTPLIGLGEQVEVAGLENAVPGATYDFYCSLHAGMKGKLVIAPAV